MYLHSTAYAFDCTLRRLFRETAHTWTTRSGGERRGVCEPAWLPLYRLRASATIQSVVVYNCLSEPNKSRLTNKQTKLHWMATEIWCKSDRGADPSKADDNGKITQLWALRNVYKYKVQLLDSRGRILIRPTTMTILHFMKMHWMGTKIWCNSSLIEGQILMRLTTITMLYGRASTTWSCTEWSQGYGATPPW